MTNSTNSFSSCSSRSPIPLGRSEFGVSGKIIPSVPSNGRLRMADTGGVVTGVVTGVGCVATVVSGI